jgi:hypothetical protein
VSAVEIVIFETRCTNTNNWTAIFFPKCEDDVPVSEIIHLVETKPVYINNIYCSVLSLVERKWLRKQLQSYVESGCQFAVRIERFINVNILSPVTVAVRSKACTVFARSEAGIVSSNPTQDMEVCYLCVYVRFSVFVYRQKT